VLFGRAALPAALLSPTGRVLRTNESLRELLGRSASELRKAAWADLTHPEFGPSSGRSLFDKKPDRELRSGSIAGLS
jgi:PAS domain-containing protein